MFLSAHAVPALTCNAPVSAEGIITATWSYIHTGGLPLTNVSVFYVFTEGSAINRIPTNVTNVNTSSVVIRNLITGFKYTFNITAENSNGSSSILCGPTLHIIGQSDS